MQKVNEASYFIVIPGFIRFDKNLSAVSKLLYGEIASKCNVKGYCWATNSFFSELFGCNIRSIQRYFKELEDGKYIRMELVKNENGTDRKIFMLDVHVCDATNLSLGGTTNLSSPYVKNDIPRGDKGVTHNNIILKKTNTKKDSLSFTNVKNKGAQSFYQNFISVYDGWFKDHNEGTPPKIDGAQGNAAKCLIGHFKSIVKARAEKDNPDSVITSSDIESKTLEAWKLVLDNWHQLEPFYQDKTRLIDINSNIQIIIQKIKDSTNGKKRTGKINANGVKSMYETINAKYGEAGGSTVNN